MHRVREDNLNIYPTYLAKILRDQYVYIYTYTYTHKYTYCIGVGVLTTRKSIWIQLQKHENSTTRMHVHL